MMKLKELLKNIEVVETMGSMNIDIQNISFDSRQILDKNLFIAVIGTNVDGHNFIKSAAENGAVAIVCEKFPDKISEMITYIKVKNSSIALGVIASNFYGNPTQNLQLVGVTGTNGKTTVATLLYRLYSKLGFKSGLISTIRNYVDKKKFEATHTTPDPIQLNRLFAEMVKQGCEYAFMEVSSHALAQNRIAGIKFCGGILTNITHDHLDYHKTFDEYLKAKKSFFDILPEDTFALVNIDDKNGKIMFQNTNALKKSYALKSFADYKCKIIESHFSGMLLKINNTEVWTKFIGEFSAYNLLAVFACAKLLGQNENEILKTLSEFTAVDGRFEYLVSKDNKIAIVDYAHTPDALLNVLKAINQIRTGKEKLITVVGAGGNRDKTKRPEMAEAAVKNSDKVILTSDNPRDENPDEIIHDMVTGADNLNVDNYICITNRREAIKTACMMANGGDIILVAGKGHETYQEVKGVKHHFNDKEELAKFLQIEIKNLQ